MLMNSQTVSKEKIEIERAVERGEICQSCHGKIIFSNSGKKVGEDGYCDSCRIRNRMNLKRD